METPITGSIAIHKPADNQWIVEGLGGLSGIQLEIDQNGDTTMTKNLAPSPREAGEEPGESTPAPEKETAVRENAEAQAPAITDEEFKKHAYDFVALLAAGKFDEASAQFAEAVRPSATGPFLSVSWKQIAAVCGKFLGADPAARVEKSDPYTSVFVPCRWEQKNLDIKVVFDAGGHVSGMWVMPTADATAATGLQFSSTGSLPQGSLSLVAVSQHPSDGAAWWAPDGSPSKIGSFKNPESSRYPNPGELAREFVFHAQGLPPGVSKMQWFVHSSERYNGEVQELPGTLGTGYYLVSTALPSSAKTIDIRAGFAMGLWETINETGGSDHQFHGSPQSGNLQWKFDYNPSGVENADGSITTYTHYSVFNLETAASVEDLNSPRSQETRVVAVDDKGEEHAGDDRKSYSDSGAPFLTTTFHDVPLEKITKFRFQARPTQWIEFHNVILNPAQPPSAAVPPAPGAAQPKAKQAGAPQLRYLAWFGGGANSDPHTWQLWTPDGRPVDDREVLDKDMVAARVPGLDKPDPDLQGSPILCAWLFFPASATDRPHIKRITFSGPDGKMLKTARRGSYAFGGSVRDWFANAIALDSPTPASANIHLEYTAGPWETLIDHIPTRAEKMPEPDDGALVGSTGQTPEGNAFITLISPARPDAEYGLSRSQR